MLARAIAYVGALALLAIVGGHLWDQLPEKTEAYRIFRRPEGGRELEAAAVISQQIRHGYAAWPRRHPQKPPSARRALIGRARQDAGFHATFWFPAALCDAVWPD